MEHEITLLAKSLAHTLAPYAFEEQAIASDCVVDIDSLNFHLQYAQPQSESVQYLKAYMTAFNDAAGICITNATGEIKYVNERFCATRGYSKTELIGTYHRFLSTALQEQMPAHIEMLTQLGSGDMWRGQINNVNKAGELYWVNVTIVPISDVDGAITQYVAVSYDVTDQVLSQQTLKAQLDSSQDRLQTIKNLAGRDWYWETDDQYRFSALDSNGHIDHEKLLGRTPWDVSGQRHTDMVNWDSHKAMLAEKLNFFDFEQPILTNNKDICFWVSMSGHAKYDKEGKFIGYNGIAKDVTERRAKEDQFWALTHLDHLTHLPNKNHFKTILDRRMISPSTSDDPFALVVLAFNDFDNLNRVYGSTAGDMHLQMIGQRMRAHLPECDILGHMPGAKFAIILVGVQSQDDAQARVEALIDCADEPFAITDQGVCKISCGISLYMTDAHTSDHLIRTSEVALRHAQKSALKSRYAFFEPKMLKAVQRYQTLTQDVRHCIDIGQLLLRYQPVVDLVSGKVIALEALMYCMHPTKGLITADQIMETFDDVTMAAKVGEVVVEKAIGQAAAWKREKIPFGKVSINVTTADFTYGDVVERIKTSLIHHRVRPQEIVIELTEGIFMGKSAEKVLQGIYDLHDYGVELALDDFGTGYTSMNDIFSLPVNRVKIDKSFVVDIETKPHSFSVIESTMDVTRKLNKDVICEGVETLSQLEVLQGMGCRFIQGYIFSKPLFIEDVVPFLLRFDAQRAIDALKTEDASPGGSV